jgi:hypothetical protein
VQFERLVPAAVLSSAVLLALGEGGTARGDDYFLTIGGGPSPYSNQVSLEKNTLFFQRMLGGLGVAADRHTVLFSDGSDPDRDLHYYDPAKPLPRANELLAALSGNEEYLRYLFRNHAVPAVAGASNKAAVRKWIADHTATLKPGDRVFVYITGHGGKGKPEDNAHFYLWRRETMNVEELAAEFDKLPPEVAVVTVMVQCYSGAFANLIFQGGKPAGEFSPANRCGFFATVQTRGAAGCTAEIEEEGYKEYSSYFLPGLCGQTRNGTRIEPPDYNHDGTISFAEAHAYALCAADTIDIPVKTSDAFLRKYSRLGKAGDGLMTLDTPYDELMGLAGPCEREVLDRLTAEFNLTGSDRIARARRRGEELDKQRRELEQQAGRKRHQLNPIRKAMFDEIQDHWPELRNPWRPGIAELLQAEGEKIVRAISSQAEFKRFQHLQGEIEKLGDEGSRMERLWAKTQRMLRVAENVALAANLPKLATREVQERYERLQAAEAGALQSPR